jgi:hypothetical protein
MTSDCSMHLSKKGRQAVGRSWREMTPWYSLLVKVTQVLWGLKDTRKSTQGWV